jgi:hypothetical protein
MWEPLIYFSYQNKNGSPNLYHGQGRKTKALGYTNFSGLMAMKKALKHYTNPLFRICGHWVGYGHHSQVYAPCKAHGILSMVRE